MVCESEISEISERGEGFEPLNLWSLDNLLYLLSHSCSTYIAHCKVTCAWPRVDDTHGHLLPMVSRGSLFFYEWLETIMAMRVLSRVSPHHPVQVICTLAMNLRCFFVLFCFRGMSLRTVLWKYLGYSVGSGKHHIPIKIQIWSQRDCWWGLNDRFALVVCQLVSWWLIVNFFSTSPLWMEKCCDWEKTGWLRQESHLGTKHGERWKNTYKINLQIR